MTESIGSTPSEADRRLISLAILKKKDGAYVVTPSMSHGTSYVLNVEQVREFERWYLGLFSETSTKKLSDQELHAFMDDWPFPDAPTTKTRTLDFIKKTILQMSVSPEAKWMVWGWFALVAVLVSISIGAIIFISNDPQIADEAVRSELVNLLTLTLVAEFILFLFPMTFVMTRRGFKKHTGRPLTPANLYLYKMGRLGGAG